MELIQQEVTQQREVEIPGPVRDVYRQWRPSPLYRARRLEKALQTPARIYYKYEGVSPAGSHKPNTAACSIGYGWCCHTHAISSTGSATRNKNHVVAGSSSSASCTAETAT